MDLTAERFSWDVSMADEAPLATLPDIPYASENYWYTAYDPVNQLAFFVSIGCWLKNTSLWRAYFSLFLPDGTVLLSQAFGRGDCSRGPASAFMAFSCMEPGRRVAIDFSGPVQHVPLDRLWNPDPRPEVLDNFELDLVWDSRTPMWFFPQTKNTTWSSWHTEQLGRVTGSVTYQGRRFAFDGYAGRDHSRGPRYIDKWRGHTWLNGQADGGLSFSVYQHWLNQDGVESQALSKAKLMRGDHCFEASVKTTPRLHSFDGVMSDYELVLESELGLTTVRGYPRFMAFLSPKIPDFSHFSPGIARDSAVWPMAVIEQPSRFEIDGRPGYGWTERSFHRRGTEAQIMDGEQLANTYATLA